MNRFRVDAARGTIVALALWVTVSILWTELGGIPNVYGWPLHVVRMVGWNQPSAWVWGVDFASAIVSLAATWFLAMRAWIAVTKGLQFRLSTLLGVTTAFAVVAAVWRWSDDNFGDVVIPFDIRGEEGVVGTSAYLDLTAFMMWLPILRLHLGVRLCVASGLGCAIYVAGSLLTRFAARLASRGGRREKGSLG